MDINLGKIILTKNQAQRLSDIKIDGIKGFCYWHGRQELVVVTERELSDAEKTQVIAQVQALPDIPIAQPETEITKLKNRIKALEIKTGIAVAGE